MVQKNDTIAIIISLLVVVLLLLGLCICCTQRGPGTLNGSSSYISSSDSEKGPAVRPSGSVPTGPDGGFNAQNGRENRRTSPPHGHLAPDGSFNVGSRRPSRAGTQLRPDGGFNIGSRQHSRRPSRAIRYESGGPAIPHRPNDQAFDIPGPSRRDQGILRNGHRMGSQGPGRVVLQPGNGGFNAAENQDGGYNATAGGTDGGFNVAGGTGNMVAAGRPAQPQQRGGQGGSIQVHEPEPGSGSGSSGGFNVD
ncbi:hypothetical protein N0V90_004390 [Kalmusia sp. IMI 367209]|nr:hypothetical protein N0V90_004390 [Kalmusia sp. IMI 367209]